MYIYADNAATTKMSQRALDAMLPFFTDVFANPSSPHTPGQRAAEALWQAREAIAAVIGCSPREITFTSGGTEADNQALLSAAWNGAKIGKKHIVSTAFEHHAVLRVLDKLERQGFSVTLLQPDRDGLIAPMAVDQAIREDTCLVSVMTANNEIGTLQPIAEIGAICREKGVVFHTDAVQAAGHIPLDVQAQNIDMLSASAHKFHGPKGVGFLYVKRGVELHAVLEGGGQERGKRAGTENLPAVVGMAAALKESQEHIDKYREKLTIIRNRIIDGIKENVPHCALNGDRDKRLPNNINMCFEGIEGEPLLLLLDHAGIAASSGSACASGSHDASHVLRSLGLPEEVSRGSLRLTIGEEITDAQAAHIVQSVTEIVARLRSLSPVWHDCEIGKRPFFFD
ncbi:MAG: cysteine desulfurase [Clostridia bacterium]|nr:cysteine desulfurase [Clostridia bacterium]